MSVMDTGWEEFPDDDQVEVPTPGTAVAPALAEEPQTPIGVSQPAAPQEQTPTPAPAGNGRTYTEEDIARIASEVGGDPNDPAVRKLAERYLNANSMAGRLGTRIGEQSAQAPQATEPAAEPAVPTPPFPATNLPEQPQEIKLYTPDQLYGPNDPIHPETGWYLGENGEPVVPYNELGIKITPPSRWQVIARELSEQHKDNPAWATQELQRKIAEDNQRIQQEAESVLRRAWQNHEVVVHQQVSSVVGEKLSKQGVTPEQINALLPVYVQQARALRDSAVQAEKVSDGVAARPSFLAECLEAVVIDAIVNGRLRDDLGKITPAAPAQPPAQQAAAPTVQPAYRFVPAGRQATMPVQGGAGGHAAPSQTPNGVSPRTGEIAVEMRGVTLTAEQVKKLSSDDYDYDEE